ncbi:MAG: DNA-3-methyladenine glycosylase I [Betaproteobacteria bacterium]|nr:DNA-3-methyladenine glycosylase I [Betaproteobacteria bacterium]
MARKLADAAAPAPLVKRCGWATNARALDTIYHDSEWGVPVHDEHALFEFLTLEGAQAGLSWSTVLAKRDRYREVFAGFDPARVARFTARQQTQLLADAGIVRNRLKVAATITNAQAFLAVQESFGSFGTYLWQFVEGAPIQNRWRRQSDVPSETSLSQKLSKDLKQRGFRFVGSTIVYAYMQAVGLVNDHLVTCHRHAAVAGLT